MRPTQRRLWHCQLAAWVFAKSPAGDARSCSCLRFRALYSWVSAVSAVQTPEPETADTVQAAAEPSGEPVGDASALLAPIEAAFARGDFLLTRALATRLLRSNPPDALRVELEAIVARTEPDRRARWVLLIAAATVFLITALAYAQGRAHLP